MFPFNTFFSSFSPFFLRNKRDQLSLGRGMGYYFSVWGIVTLLIILIGVIAGWIFVTPAVVSPLLDRIPPFDAVTENGLLVKTGLSTDPFEYEIEGFQIFISSTLTEIPAEKRGTPGIFILRDHALVNQMEDTVNKSQSVIYADSPELKNFNVDNAILKAKILKVLPEIKKVLVYTVIFALLLITAMLSVWYLIFSFFWALIVFLVSKSSRAHLLTYEQSLSFVLSTFFPVMLLSLMLMVSGFYFPFLMTFLFLGMFGYNHLSFYKNEK